jgi:hypothetical protein
VQNISRVDILPNPIANTGKIQLWDLESLLKMTRQMLATSIAIYNKYEIKVTLTEQEAPNKAKEKDN